MEIIPLLHRIPAGLGKGDQIPRLSKKGEPIPADWVPADLRYVPEAFPTPFGRSEATRIALESLDKAQGNKLVVSFNTMLLGVAAGELDVEPFHLKHADYDNLGRALLKVDAEVEYLAWVRDGSGRAFGVSSPDCLFWGHSRREDGEWNDLNERIQSRKQKALELLADLREALTRSGRWAPAKIAWQIGLLALTEKTPPSADLSRLAAATTIGPVRVRMPKGDGSGETMFAPLYLPRLALNDSFDASKWFFSLLSCTLRDSADGQALDLVDPATTKTAARIAMPPGTTESLPIYLGMGRLFTGPDAPIPSGPPNQEHVSAGLDRIRTELRRIGIDPPKDGSDVAPIVPDVLRFLAIAKSRLSRATTGWPAGCKFTSRATAELARAELGPPNENDTACVRLENGTAFGLVDRVGTSAVLDLRALGWVLFQAFTRAREPSALTPLIVSTDKHPLEPAAAAYTEVSGNAGTMAMRLATLQRFLAAYTDPVSDLEIASSRAAASFARWAAGFEVAPMGRKGSRDGVVTTAVSLGQAPLLVARDPVLAAVAGTKQ